MKRQKVPSLLPALLVLGLLALAWPAAGTQARAQAAVTIAEARALPLGTSVTVEGVVTVAAGTYNAGFAIQDETAGIYVYPSSFLSVQPGETVRIFTGAPVPPSTYCTMGMPVAGSIPATHSATHGGAIGSATT